MKWKVWLENDSKYFKITTNTGSWYEHPLFSSRIVRMDLLSFIKPLKVILIKRFVLIKQNPNFKRKYDDCSLNIKYFPIWVVNMCGQMLCFLYCIPSSSYSKDDLSFWQFWKIMILTWILGEGLLHIRISSLYFNWLSSYLRLKFRFCFIKTKCFGENYV